MVTGIDVASTIDVEPCVFGKPIPLPIFLDIPPPILP